MSNKGPKLVPIAAKLFDMCPENKITERSLTYLIKLSEGELGQVDLFTLLCLSWKDRKKILQSKRSGLSDHALKFSKEKGTGLEMFENFRKEGTILECVMEEMVNGTRARMRKLSAYLLCILTYRNQEVQTKFCEMQGFSSSQGVILLNNVFMTQVVKQHEFDQQESLKAKIIGLMKVLKETAEMRYTQYAQVQENTEQLLFFCYPDYDKELSSLNDFPDPKEYFIGIFTCSQTKPEREVALSQSTSTYTSKVNKCSFITSVQTTSFQNESNTYDSREKSREDSSFHPKSDKTPKMKKQIMIKSKEKFKGYARAQTSKAQIYRFKNAVKRVQKPKKPTKEEEFRRKVNQVYKRRYKEPKSLDSKTRQQKIQEVTQRLSKPAPKKHLSQTKRNMPKRAVNKRSSVQTEKLTYTQNSIGEYYYQMTNNININVDLDKRAVSETFSERNRSVSSNSNCSVMTPGQITKQKVLQRIQDRKKRFQSNPNPALESARKVAGKHISIFLNTKKTTEGEGIDIQICHQPNMDTLNSSYGASSYNPSRSYYRRSNESAKKSTKDPKKTSLSPKAKQYLTDSSLMDEYLKAHETRSARSKFQNPKVPFPHCPKLQKAKPETARAYPSKVDMLGQSLDYVNKLLPKRNSKPANPFRAKMDMKAKSMIEGVQFDSGRKVDGRRRSGVCSEKKNFDRAVTDLDYFTLQDDRRSENKIRPSLKKKFPSNVSSCSKD